ncbi:hypothetical protein OG689_17525 [Kitasatospora sp. NBC_00240]|uniref:hypothetical protein n=1 Tax=Kitasatospora sp. NBC_00240 TaxID=2903567 RepID=UPI00225652B9|nr:hypothetical protein [Kitasatospora sp. NBC_00240]MCX5211071.1 hypothetical protein [Kitasatospora sp. NBC_00240]
MPEPTLLIEAVDRLADRFRAMPQSRLLAAVPGHVSRATAGLALARTLAAVAQALEGRQPQPFPDAGAFAAGDQLAVAGHDLAAAVAVAGGDPVVLPVSLGALPAGGPADPAAVLGEALAAVAATAGLCA